MRKFDAIAHAEDVITNCLAEQQLQVPLVVRLLGMALIQAGSGVENPSLSGIVLAEFAN